MNKPKPIVTVVGLPSFIDDACTEAAHSLDEQYPDGNRVHEALATGLFGCDPSRLAELREQINRCTCLEEVEALLEEIHHEA